MQSLDLIQSFIQSLSVQLIKDQRGNDEDKNHQYLNKTAPFCKSNQYFKTAPFLSKYQLEFQKDPDRIHYKRSQKQIKKHKTNVLDTKSQLIRRISLVMRQFLKYYQYSQFFKDFTKLNNIFFKQIDDRLKIQNLNNCYIQNIQNIINLNMIQLLHEPNADISYQRHIKKYKRFFMRNKIANYYLAEFKLQKLNQIKPVFQIVPGQKIQTNLLNQFQGLNSCCNNKVNQQPNFDNQSSLIEDDNHGQNILSQFVMEQKEHQIAVDYNVQQQNSSKQSLSNDRITSVAGSNMLEKFHLSHHKIYQQVEFNQSIYQQTSKHQVDLNQN